jgi:hypothetical protein
MKKSSKVLFVVACAVGVSGQVRAELNSHFLLQDLGRTAGQAVPRPEGVEKPRGQDPVVDAESMLGLLKARTNFVDNLVDVNQKKVFEGYTQVEGLNEHETRFMADPFVEFGMRGAALRLEAQKEQIKKWEQKLKDGGILTRDDENKIAGMLVRTDADHILGVFGIFCKFQYDQIMEPIEKYNAEQMKIADPAKRKLKEITGDQIVELEKTAAKWTLMSFTSDVKKVLASPRTHVQGRLADPEDQKMFHMVDEVVGINRADGLMGGLRVNSYPENPPDELTEKGRLLLRKLAMAVKDSDQPYLNKLVEHMYDRGVNAKDYKNLKSLRKLYKEYDRFQFFFFEELKNNNRFP